MEARYLYCIFDGNAPVSIIAGAVGNAEEPVYLLEEGGLGLVLSKCDPDRCPVNRVNLLGHQTIMEQAMASSTVLPIRFGTLAKADDSPAVEELIRSRLLRARSEELHDLLNEMRGKQEMSLKVLWRDVNAAVKAIAESDPDIRRLRSKITGKSEAATRPDRIRLGTIVEERLHQARDRHAQRLLAVLNPLVARTTIHQDLGDRMLLNAAFLMETARREAFEEILESLIKESPDFAFKYVGPMPPCSFVDLVISWDEPKKRERGMSRVSG